MEECHNYQGFPTEWLGAWESINANPDVYIFQGYDGNYYLLAYSYDRESEWGSFSCYDIDWDKEDCYIRMGIKRYYLSEEKQPYGLYIGVWGSYMRN